MGDKTLGMSLDITPVLAKSKDFEYLVMTFDPIFGDLLRVLEVVKEFITRNDLIIYGGTALDMALRLKGDRIYPDELPSDLDFYSPNNIEHAYQIADILYKMGFKSVRAIMASHIHTMRVDMIDDHFVADLSYQPQEVFNVISTLKYKGMRIVHPYFQRIDQHSALSFPYDNPPKEVIFARWRNDVKRFNLAAKYYPEPDYVPSAVPVKLKVARFPIISRAVYAGFGAYALIYYHFDVLTDNVINRVQNNPDFGELTKQIIRSDIKIDESTIEFHTLNDTLEIMHYDIEKCSFELELTDIKLYEPFGSMIPEKATGIFRDKNITILGNKHRLIAINSIDINGVKFRTLNVQPVLKYFLSMYYILINDKKNKHNDSVALMYLQYYKSLLAMINVIELLISNEILQSNCIHESPLFLSIETYGNENISLATEVAMQRLNAELNDIPMQSVPINYYPERSNGKPHPVFDYSSSVHFCERGRQKI